MSVGDNGPQGSQTSEVETLRTMAKFGAFEVDIGSGELRRKGVKIKLQDLPFRFLALLLEEPGALVTRDDLRERLWPPETFVDFDRSINTAANKLREALGDTAENPVFIETLPRRGYRFIAPVQQLRDTPPLPRQAQPQWSWGRRGLLAAAGIVTFMALLAAYYSGRSPSLPPEVSPDRLRLVVLPLSDYSGLRDGQLFADGLTEEVTARLGQLDPRRLGVIGRTSAMTFRNKAKSIDEIGGELDVDYVIEGSIRGDGDRRHVTVQLIEVRDQTHVWAQTYEYDAADVLELQKDVADQVAEALSLEVLYPRDVETTVPPEIDTELNEAYLRGRFFRGQLTESGYRRGIEHFSRAIELNPQFAPAYAGLAGCFCLLAGHGLEVLSVPEAMIQARDAAAKALDLSPDSAEAHAAMGMAAMKYEWDGAKAEHHFLRAIEINPSYSQARLWYSIYLTAVERHDEAVAAAFRARELDPLALSANINLAQQLYEAGRYQEAVAHLNSSMELAPASWGMHWSLGESYRELGRHAEAIDSLERAAGLDGGDNSLVIASLGYTYGIAMMEEPARAQLARLTDTASGGYVSPAHIAAIHAGLGDTTEVFRWLEQAYEVRSRSLIWLRVANEYASVRSDPRFIDLVARVGL